LNFELQTGVAHCTLGFCGRDPKSGCC